MSASGKCGAMKRVVKKVASFELIILAMPFFYFLWYVLPRIDGKTLGAAYFDALNVSRTSVEGIGILVGVFLAITYKSISSRIEKLFFVSCLFYSTLMIYFKMRAIKILRFTEEEELFSMMDRFSDRYSQASDWSFALIGEGFHASISCLVLVMLTFCIYVVSKQ